MSPKKFVISAFDRPTRATVFCLLAFAGSLLLGQTYLPTVSYFWALGAGRVLLGLAAALVPRSQAGKFRPFLVLLPALTFIVTLPAPASVFARWVGVTLVYLCLEVALDALVLEHATEEETPLELGLLAASRLMGLWTGLVLQYSDLSTRFDEVDLTRTLLLSCAVLWMVLREKAEDSFSPGGLPKSLRLEQLGDSVERLSAGWTLAALLNLSGAAALAGAVSGAILPYPLLYPSEAGSWLEGIVPNLKLLGVGLLGVWFFEKARLRTQLLVSALSVTSLVLLAQWKSVAFPVWGVLLTSILLSSRAVLRETYRLDPVLRAVLAITCWTAGGLAGDRMRHLEHFYLIGPCLGLALLFALFGVRHYLPGSRRISINEQARSERFGDRTQDFEGAPTTAPKKPRGRFLRALSNYLLVHLPVMVFLVSLGTGLAFFGFYVVKNKVTWQRRVENATRVFRTELFFSAFSRRLQEDMVASRRVPTDWNRFIAQNFSSDGKPLTDIDRWGTPYRFRVSKTQVTIESAGPDTHFGTSDDLERTVERPEGVKG